jgi:signal transduction histidine kinase
VLTVTDDGRGLAGSSPGVGIRAMTERASELGGTLTLESPAVGGCRVRTELPVGG